MPHINKNLLVLIIIIISASVMYLISSYPKTKMVTCTQEARVCPDGSSVGRSGPKCEFAACPTITPEKKIQREMCGGFAGVLCPEGYICDKKENYPDASGTCIKISP